MPKKILVVDDSPIVRNLHSATLESAGFEVEEAANGYDALNKAGNSTFDLMVVDLNMPGMDGFTLCREIRSSEKNQNTPLLIVSTRSEAEDKMKGFRAGANLYLVKPVKSEVLIENAKLLLNGR
ncbi:MAG: response regulator [Proteobacteria bacterium]|nr:response regulator [Pseudomonadota bacterium]